MNPHPRAVGLVAAALLSAFSTAAASGQAFQVYDPPSAAAYAGPPTLGTFEPTPYIMVGGAAPLSRGYSPMGIYGAGSMALDGPFSPMRSTSAPVTTYSRGYDGVVHAERSTSFSNPNQPRLSPFVYPTQRNNYYAPRWNPSPARWITGADWVDLN